MFVFTFAFVAEGTQGRVESTRRHPKFMLVAATPTHCALNYPVELAQCAIARFEHAAPDWRCDVAESNLELEGVGSAGGPRFRAAIIGGSALVHTVGITLRRGVGQEDEKLFSKDRSS